VLKLTQEQLVHALGIAGSYPALGEMRVGQISMMKSMSAGLAASRGVEAAYLAREGITGPGTIFEGQRGIEKLVVGECDWDLFTAPMGDWRLPRTCLKRYPAAYIIHSSIDATLSLREEHAIAPRDVSEVVVDAFGWLIEDMVDGMGGISRYEIDARETADHSLPYCVAVSLVEGKYDIGQLRSQRWEAPEVRQMIARTRCVHDRGMDASFPPDRPSRVTIRMQDGRTFTKEVAYPLGDYRSPFTDDELAAKFRSLSADVLAPPQQERAIECALDFSNRTVESLVRACDPQAPG
jgi:2-methylcitrate dehydratase